MGDLSMSPELRELLGELAYDPRVQLLRVKAAQAAREGLERSPKVSSSAPFLAKAERRLLELHREELGRLLYAYAHIARMQVPENAKRVHYADWRIPEPTKAATDHRARALLRTRGAEEPEAELLRRCLTTIEGIRPSAIIGALMRVAPSDKGSIALGLDFTLESSLEEGGAILRAYLKKPGSRFDSYAWENLAINSAVKGRLYDAAAHYKAAVTADRARVVPALDWLLLSVMAESEGLAREAAAYIDRCIPAGLPAVGSYFQHETVGASIVVRDSVRALARAVGNDAGPVSKKVIRGLK